jgi:hypothetical protein
MTSFILCENTVEDGYAGKMIFVLFINTAKKHAFKASLHVCFSELSFK